MMAACGIILPLVGIVFGDWFWLEGYCGGVGAPPSSEMSTLGSEVLRGFNIGCGLVYSRRVEASSDVMVASMASLERGRAMVEHLEDGYKTHKALQW
jgi:hypothetical protein